MLIEDFDLPYEYNENSRAGSVWIAAGLVIASIVMFALNFFGYFVIPWYVIAAPVAFVAHRAYTFSIYRNAFHEAIRDADMDRKLDAIVEEKVARANRTGSVLNSESFTKRLLESQDVE